MRLPPVKHGDRSVMNRDVGDAVTDNCGAIILRCFKELR